MNGIVSICQHSERELSQMETIFNNLCGNSNLDFWVYALHYCHTNWCRFQSSWCAPERTMKSLWVCQTLTQSDIRGEEQRYIYGDEWHQNTSETLGRDFFDEITFSTICQCGRKSREIYLPTENIPTFGAWQTLFLTQTYSHRKRGNEAHHVSYLLPSSWQQIPQFNAHEPDSDNAQHCIWLSPAADVFEINN